jgi:hypothetical protein
LDEDLKVQWDGLQRRFGYVEGVSSKAAMEATAVGVSGLVWSLCWEAAWPWEEWRKAGTWSQVATDDSESEAWLQVRWGAYKRTQQESFENKGSLAIAIVKIAPPAVVARAEATVIAAEPNEAARRASMKAARAQSSIAMALAMAADWGSRNSSHEGKKETQTSLARNDYRVMERERNL